MTTVYFADGAPSELDGVTVIELYVLYRVVMTTKTEVRCQFRCGRRLLSIDIKALEPVRTFGSLYRKEDFP